MDGVNDLGCVDPVEIDRRHAKVDMAELALDHVEGHALAGHLNGMGVAKLVWREAPPHSGIGCDAAQVVARSGWGPWPPPGLTIDHTEQRADRHRNSTGEQRSELLTPTTRRIEKLERGHEVSLVEQPDRLIYRAKRSALLLARGSETVE